MVIIKRFFTTKFMGINSKNRLDFVDGLKGVAIILVVLGHIVDGYLNNGVDIDNNSVYWSIYNVIYSFHMPLFMMISGYLYEYAYFHEKKGKYKRLLAQTVNLLVVYVLFSILFSAIKLKFAGLIREKVTFFDIKHIFEYTIAPFWYLYILIVFYLCFIPIRKIPHYISLPLLTVLNLYSANWQKIGEKFEWYRLTYYALFFLFGIVIRNNKIRYRLNNEISKSIKLTMSVTLMIFAVILIVLNWNYKDAVFINEIPITSTVVATSFSMGIWILFRYYLFLSNDKGLIIKYLGKKTLEIYILHIIFVAFFRNVFYKVGTSNLVVSVLLNLVFSIVFSIIIANILIKLNVHGMVFKPFTVLFLGDKSIRKKKCKKIGSLSYCMSIWNASFPCNISC